MSGGTVDVRDLPTYGFGTRSLMWWGTVGLMLIEGTVFAIALLMYFYLRGIAPAWPLGAPLPALRWGVANTLLLLASLWPNWRAQRAAQREDRAAARRWLAVCVLMALGFLVLRALEFRTLGVSWHANAYGSLVWLLLGLHTTHLITDTIDTLVLTVLLYSGPFEGKRMVDVAENALYWYFVVGSWLPVWAVIYLAPRL
ncbi:cytochrome c oxidase subunit 3 [Xylophilus sp.]|uniref:cytochrome c oxidase subunit 3 n=1 Tax=Xylophilus sp. TaxID=2653893 RepID=UPI0013BD8674|nr:cytochrome c oxidase subunit 3 [Xylophilus sp.]KAF1047440.1 MAG: putative cytochrome c oxidase subunit 3 [Xylophilus sp.]